MVFRCEVMIMLDQNLEAATKFSVSLLQTLVVEEPNGIPELHDLDDVALAKATLVLGMTPRCVGPTNTIVLQFLIENVVKNYLEAATEFSISLLQTLVVEESKVIPELHNLIDALVKILEPCQSSHVDQPQILGL
ncbi:hypothetical protein RIF29_00396 [Crotalaria pallida]|uniref:Uncharacterized protein n=1 Tax=Crotalaria pallida TaxID=3830 RepID=A0AAN9P7F2_CROPI